MDTLGPGCPIVSGANLQNLAPVLGLRAVVRLFGQDALQLISNNLVDYHLGQKFDDS